MKAERSIIENLPETIVTPPEMRGRKVEVLYVDLEDAQRNKAQAHQKLPYYGSIELTIDPMEYQRSVRGEWD